MNANRTWRTDIFTNSSLLMFPRTFYSLPFSILELDTLPLPVDLVLLPARSFTRRPLLPLRPSICRPLRGTRENVLVHYAPLGLLNHAVLHRQRVAFLVLAGLAAVLGVGLHEAVSVLGDHGDAGLELFSVAVGAASGPLAPIGQGAIN